MKKGFLYRGAPAAAVMALLCLFALMGPLGCERQKAGETPAPGVEANDPYDVKAGAVAPPFAIVTFDGSEFALSSTLGRPVVINFWASWCGPCRLEAPYLQDAYIEYGKRGVEFVGIAVQDRPDNSKAFIEHYGWTFPTGPDVGDEIMAAYRVYAVPKTVIIDRSGRISHVHTGVITPDIISRELARVL